MCATHVPRANLLYSPRNKILATSLLIEAFLYEEQTRRGVSLRHFDEFGDVADHCTVCHKCVNPCPVDIDFGDVSIAMRNLLRAKARSSFNPGTAASMCFLNATDPTTIKLPQDGDDRLGLPRAAARPPRRPRRSGLRAAQTTRPPSTASKRAAGSRRSSTSSTSRCRADLPKRTARALLDIEDSTVVPIIRDPSKVSRGLRGGVLFPGLRLRAAVLAGRASPRRRCSTTSARRCVLPPGYLCCGYPQTSAGDHDKGQEIITDNRVLFHRVANTLNYLDIKTVIVSCGTCMDQLQKYEFEKIFPGCRLLDIHEYLMEKGVALEGVEGVRYMYHDPCHTPMKTHAPLKVVSKLMGTKVPLNDRCCGESGTLATTRPDISTQVRFRKEEEMRKGADEAARRRLRRRGQGADVVPVVPAGAVALRQRLRTRKADYIVVEIARHVLGENWMAEYVKRANQGGIERVLV